MKKVKLTQEIDIEFKNIVVQYEISDVGSMIQEISGTFENYDCDCEILNKIISIILNCNPTKEDLFSIEINKLKELLNILN